LPITIYGNCRYKKLSLDGSGRFQGKEMLGW